MRNYNDLVKGIQNRTNPDMINESELFEEKFSAGLKQPSNKKVLEYIKRAMHGVEVRYTERTIEAGKKVMKHLKENNPNIEYRFQGSVMTNTHIKGHSDIDLLQITNTFYSHDSRDVFNDAYNSFHFNSIEKNRILNLLNSSIFTGSPNNTLSDLRKTAEVVLQNNYKYVNINKSKSIEVKPTNPPRLVDVVTASYYETVKSVTKSDLAEKGIQVYDKENDTRLDVDYPFLKIKLVNEKDKSVNGRLKKMIRFIKNIKVDSGYSEQLKELTSFDITSICYAIPAVEYMQKSYIELVPVLLGYFEKIIIDSDYRNSLISVDGTEPIFKGKDEKVRVLGLLLKELFEIVQDVRLQEQTPARFF